MVPALTVIYDRNASHPPPADICASPGNKMYKNPEEIPKKVVKFRPFRPLDNGGMVRYIIDNSKTLKM